MLWLKIRQSVGSFIQGIKNFNTGVQPDQGLKSLFFNTCILLPLNLLFFGGLYKLYHLHDTPLDLFTVLALFLASPLILLELFCLVFSIIERRMMSLMLYLNFFVSLSWIFFSYQKFSEKVERFFERLLSREEQEEWDFFNHYAPRVDLPIPQKKSDLPIKTLDLWSQICDAKNFVSNNFNSSQALLRFFKERFQKPGENVLDQDFLYFSLLIPKRRELSVEGLKTILLSYPGIKDNPFYNKLSRGLLDNTLLSESFKNYNEGDLKKLFSRRYSPVDYFEVISKLSNHNLELPVMDNFKELLVFLNQNHLSHLHHPILSRLHNQKMNTLTFVLLNSKEEYNLWAKKLNNCIERSYWEMDDVDIIGVYRGRQFYGALSFRLGNFEQIKGYSNLDLPKEEVDQIVEFIKEKLNLL